MDKKRVISKTILVDEIAADTKAPKATVKTIVDSFWKFVAMHAAEGEDVSFIGFGKFYKKHTDARTGRNPQTGEAMEIAASDKLAFKSNLKF